MNRGGRHTPKVQPEYEMPAINAGLMPFNKLNEVGRRAKPELLAFLQMMHLALSVLSINTVMLVQHIL
jgi:hypothetical protein